jgi:VCBS repeat-containing protein
MANIDLVGQITEGNLSTIDNGIIQFTDPDLWTGTPTPHTITFVPQAATGYLGTFTTQIINPATDDGDGVVRWTLTTTEDQLNFLAQGETRVQSYNLTLTDASEATSQKTVVVTITGTNDAPVFGSGNTTGSVTEIVDGGTGENSNTLTSAGSIAFTDVDLTDTHTVDATPNGTGYLGSFSASKGTGKTADWTFSVGDGALDYLAQGQALTQTYNVVVTDDKGGTATQAVVITLTGTNDVPTVDDSTQSQPVTELSDGNANETTGQRTATGSFSFADVDLTDAHTISAVRVSGDAVLGALTASVTNVTTGDGTGTVGWNFAVDNAAIDYLAKDQVVNQTFTITLNDGKGGTVTKNVAIAITGTNDAPILTVSPSGSVIEDTGVNGYSKLVATGAVSYTDVDTIDTHTVTYTYKEDAVWSGGEISETSFTNGSFSASSADGWKYKVDNSAVQFLAVGETMGASHLCSEYLYLKTRS